MISMYSAREQAADRFNHSPEAEAYRRAHGHVVGGLDADGHPFYTYESPALADLRASLIAQGCTATSPARLDDEGERMAREERWDV